MDTCTAQEKNQTMRVEERDGKKMGDAGHMDACRVNAWKRTERMEENDIQRAPRKPVIRHPGVKAPKETSFSPRMHRMPRHDEMKNRWPDRGLKRKSNASTRPHRARVAQSILAKDRLQNCHWVFRTRSFQSSRLRWTPLTAQIHTTEAFSQMVPQ